MRSEGRQKSQIRSVGLMLGLTVTALLPFTACAEQVEPEDVFHGDYAIVGVGVGSLPTYQGSDNSRIIPLAGATGEVSGIGFTIRGPSLTLDLLTDRPGRDVNFGFGPQIAYQADRSGHIGDEVVARLGKLKKTVGAGFKAGVSFKNVMSKKDRLSVGVSASWDVTGHSDGMVVSPSMTYFLPVGRGQVFGALVSTQFGNANYANYHFGVTPEGSGASGLPVFHGKGGFEAMDVGLATARDLDGNFLNGGFSIVAAVRYSRLFGSAAKSPITSLRGSRNQWSFGGGLAYTF